MFESRVRPPITAADLPKLDIQLQPHDGTNYNGKTAQRSRDKALYQPRTRELNMQVRRDRDAAGHVMLYMVNDKLAV